MFVCPYVRWSDFIAFLCTTWRRNGMLVNSHAVCGWEEDGEMKSWRMKEDSTINTANTKKKYHHIMREHVMKKGKTIISAPSWAFALRMIIFRQFFLSLWYFAFFLGWWTWADDDHDHAKKNLNSYVS